MSGARPTVSPQLVAAAIESAPDRVRRRLDRAPAAAAGWEWMPGDDGWTVDTGGEKVRLPRESIHSLDQLSCTCLLTPHCFHVLACLTALEVAMSDRGNDVSAGAGENKRIEETPNAAEEVVQPTESQRRAAGELAEVVARLLQVGVAHAGVVAQSEMLRAVHQCRAEGLHRAAAVGRGVRAAAGPGVVAVGVAHQDVPGRSARDRRQQGQQ